MKLSLLVFTRMNVTTLKVLLQHHVISGCFIRRSPLMCTISVTRQSQNPIDLFRVRSMFRMCSYYVTITFSIWIRECKLRLFISLLATDSFIVYYESIFNKSLTCMHASWFVSCSYLESLVYLCVPLFSSPFTTTLFELKYASSS
jgi:hypothetical protein